MRSRSAKDVSASIAALHQVGIPVAFNFGADIDLNDLDRHIGYFSQGGLGLPDPAYYTRTDADTRKLLGRYNGYVQKILVLTGTPADKAAAEAQQVIDLETRIAQSSQAAGRCCATRARTTRRCRSPTSAKSYRKLQLGEFLKAQGVNDDAVSIANPQLFAQLDQLVGSLKPAQWKAYLRWHVGDAMAPYLAKPWRDAELRFPRPRAARASRAGAALAAGLLDAINLAAGPDAGPRIRRALPARRDTRSRAEEIATNVRDALDARDRQRSAPGRAGQGRSQGQARRAQDRDRRPAPRPRLHRAADGPRQLRQQHADRLHLAPPRGNEAHRPRQRRPPLGRAAAAAGPRLRHRAEPPDRHCRDAAGAGVRRDRGHRRAVRLLRCAGRPRTQPRRRQQGTPGRRQGRSARLVDAGRSQRVGRAGQPRRRAVRRLSRSGAAGTSSTANQAARCRHRRPGRRGTGVGRLQRRACRRQQERETGVLQRLGPPVAAAADHGSGDRTRRQQRVCARASGAPTGRWSTSRRSAKPSAARPARRCRPRPSSASRCGRQRCRCVPAPARTK